MVKDFFLNFCFPTNKFSNKWNINTQQISAFTLCNESFPLGLINAEVKKIPNNQLRNFFLKKITQENIFLSIHSFGNIN